MTAPAPTPPRTGRGDDIDRPAALRGPDREAALERTFGMLVGVARGEVRRRGGELRLGGAEADDLAHQAAADALVRIDAKLEAEPGQGDDLGAFLRQGRELAAQEEGTVTWYAFPPRSARWRATCRPPPRTSAPWTSSR